MQTSQTGPPDRSDRSGLETSHYTPGRSDQSPILIRPVRAREPQNHCWKAPLGPSSQDLIIQEVLSYFSEALSQDPHLGDLWALLTESNNQCCIPLDSTTYIYSRLNIKHKWTSWALNHFGLAILWLCQPWDFNIVSSFLDQIHTWASDLELPTHLRICPWNFKSLHKIYDALHCFSQ